MLGKTDMIIESDRKGINHFSPVTTKQSENFLTADR